MFFPGIHVVSLNIPVFHISAQRYKRFLKNPKNSPGKNERTYRSKRTDILRKTSVRSKSNKRTFFRKTSQRHNRIHFQAGKAHCINFFVPLQIITQRIDYESVRLYTHTDQSGGRAVRQPILSGTVPPAQGR